MNKGQTFLSDFAVSIALFTMILGAFFFPWNSMLEKDSRFSLSEEMKTQAERTMAFLVTTNGYPDNWEKESVNVSIPGFSREKDNVIEIEKIQEFGNLSLEKQKSVLQVDNFYLTVENESGVIEHQEESLAYGVEPTPDRNPETVVKVDREVLLDLPEKNVNGKISLVIWR